MAFLSPLALAGLGVVAAPIAIHLLNKIRIQVVRWAATRFLQESLQKNQRKLQLEDLLLLLTRCALIALLALSFARPVINPGGDGSGILGEPAVAVLIIDQSASMGQSDGVKTRMDLAKAAARKQLDELGKSSQAALFFVTDRVNQAVGRPTNNFALLRRSIDLAEPSCRTSDLFAGVRVAIDMLRPFSSGKKEIILFTDNQAVAWKQLDQLKPLLGEQADVHLRVVQAGNKAEENMAITAFKPESIAPVVGQLFRCLVEVSNYGNSRATGVRVTLSLVDAAPSDEAVIDQIEPGKSRSVRLNVRFVESGYQTLRAAIPPDRLPIDDQRTLAVRVIDQVRAAVVESSRPRSNVDRDAFFLANALMPIPPAMREAYYLKAEAMEASKLEETNLNPYNLIFLCNPSAIRESASRNLLNYVKEGGSLVIFPGPNVTPRDFNENAILKPMMPAELQPLTDTGKEGNFLAWQPSKYPHPVTSLWNYAENGNLGEVRVTKYFPLKANRVEGEVADKAPKAIVSYTDGTPAVMERAFGKGRVILFSSSATTQWSNLPIHPSFVPLIQRLCGYLLRRDPQGSLSLMPGSVYQQTVSTDLVGREFSVARPDSKGQLRPAGKVETERGEAVIRYANTETAGAYRLMVNGVDRPVGAFSVQVDPAESNLTVIPNERLAVLDNDRQQGSSTEVNKPAKTKHDFTDLLLCLAAAAALLEMYMGHKFSLAK